MQQTFLKMPKQPNTIFNTDNILTGRTQIEASIGANSDDFTIDSNNVLNLKNKTSYLSIPGVAFQYQTEGSVTDEVLLYDNGQIELDETGSADGFFYVPVELPHGSIVTAAVVYGSDTAGSWELKRAELNGSGSDTDMATGAIDTQDTSINQATIDNSTYYYYLKVIANNAGDLFHGARITYTTDYD